MTNPLPSFVRLHTVDNRDAFSLTSLMRWMALIALAAFLANATASAQTEPKPTPVPKPVKTPSSLPTPKAEPENSGGYLPPQQREEAGPSDADRGPVQKHFALAATVVDPSLETSEEDSNRRPAEKIALDKRINVPLIHDVQNDGSYKAASNPALRGERDYLNWGAVTEEQLKARRGHYFTITWANHGPRGDFTTEFEYRQVKSKEIVRILTQKLTNVSGSARSYFAVIDQAYSTYGPVSSWRFTVRKGDTVVAEAKSFIW
jgi:hypothetical protein